MGERISHFSAFLWAVLSCSCIGALEQLLGEGNAVQLQEKQCVGHSLESSILLFRT